MCGTWDLRQLLADLHHDVEQRLGITVEQWVIR